MKNISILVAESSVLEGISNPKYLFTVANQFLINTGNNPAFNVQLVGEKNTISLLGGIFTTKIDKLYDEVRQTDLIIIPPFLGDMKKVVEQNSAAIPWIKNQYKKGAEVASLCVGAFLLASTGLLNNKKCSTHWAFYNEFRKSFPAVEVMDGAIITEENRIYSSGGANSSWNLLLYLLEKYTNRDIAILAAKYFAIDIDRESQSSFTIFNGQKNHNDEEIKISQEFVEKNYSKKIRIDQLAKLVAIGPRTFERRFKQATNNTVNEYIQRVKVEAAKRNFESTRKNISEVMLEVGYSDIKTFRKVFRKITGLTPIAYRNKYYKNTRL